MTVDPQEPLDYATPESNLPPPDGEGSDSLFEGFGRAILLVFFQGLWLPIWSWTSWAEFLRFGSPYHFLFYVAAALPSLFALGLGVLHCSIEYNRGCLHRHWKVAVPGMALAVIFIGLAILAY